MKYLITALLLLGFTIGCDKRCVEDDEVISIGGCRCIEIRDPSLRHFTQMANPQSVLKLIAIIEKLKEQRNQSMSEEYVWQYEKLNKELDEIVGQE